MARIRSIHPGLASDEIYMSMSMAAKAAWPMLWTECDDSGVFEWKPIVLKARIFPADNVDFEGLLDEFVRLGCVRKDTVGGKTYGSIRNFAKYQRPKNPSFRFSVTPEMAEFTGANERVEGKPSPSPPPALPQPSPSPPENPPQREEEGGRREIDSSDSELSTSPERARSPEVELRVAIVDAYRAAGQHLPPETGHCAVWLAQGFPPDLCLSVIRSKMPAARDKGLKWFDKAISEAFAKRATAPPGSAQSGAPGDEIVKWDHNKMPAKNLELALMRYVENPSSWLLSVWGDPPPKVPFLLEFAAKRGIAIEATR
jgi:hypothetical protein